MKVDLLYFNGCPSWEQGLKNLIAALDTEGVNAEVQLRMIEDDVMASRVKFLGSPSFMIDSQDFWPEERESYHMSCRVYATENGLQLR